MRGIIITSLVLNILILLILIMFIVAGLIAKDSITNTINDMKENTNDAQDGTNQ